jgi:hypothetical protein
MEFFVCLFCLRLDWKLMQALRSQGCTFPVCSLIVHLHVGLKKQSGLTPDMLTVSSDHSHFGLMPVLQMIFLEFFCLSSILW